MHWETKISVWLFFFWSIHIIVVFCNQICSISEVPVPPLFSFYSWEAKTQSLSIFPQIRQLAISETRIQNQTHISETQTWNYYTLLHLAISKIPLNCRICLCSKPGVFLFFFTEERTNSITSNLLSHFKENRENSRNPLQKRKPHRAPLFPKLIFTVSFQMSSWPSSLPCRLLDLFEQDGWQQQRKTLK